MPSRSYCRSINSPAPLAYSKSGFTLIETLVSIGIFVLLIIGGTTLYVQWRATTDHSETVTTITNLIQTAEHNALSSVSGTNWVLEEASSSSLRLRNATSSSVTTITLPDSATIDWHTKNSYIFYTPNGFVDQSGAITIHTANRSTDILIRQNGTISLSATTL